ncbi:unnamed protein product [[Actinomadura] parvosata subsp. kistnae]|nr:unnamed protein product [Actinomadura parvosata subsp. kistnae]
MRYAQRPNRLTHPPRPPPGAAAASSAHRRHRAEPAGDGWELPRDSAPSRQATARAPRRLREPAGDAAEPISFAYPAVGDSAEPAAGCTSPGQHRERTGGSAEHAGSSAKHASSFALRACERPRRPHAVPRALLPQPVGGPASM